MDAQKFGLRSLLTYLLRKELRMADKLRKSSRDAANILAQTEDLLFTPTPSQRKSKATFWLRMEDNVAFDAESATLADVTQLTNSAQVKDWWAKPGFREWFLNRDEHRQTLEYLYGLGLETAERILRSTEPKAMSAQVNILKVLGELASKFPRQKESGRYLDATIQKMDKLELAAYLEKEGVQVKIAAQKIPEVIDVSPSDSEENT
jgi:hypothetical protein